jgi:hypothetical protein
MLAASYQSIVAPELAVALRVTVPVPHLDAGVEVATVGKAFTVIELETYSIFPGPQPPELLWNQHTPSFTVENFKVVAPAVLGAVTLNVTSPDCPGAIDE